MYDRSQSIRASVDDVKFSLALSICLVVLVIFIFLRNITATLKDLGWLLVVSIVVIYLILGILYEDFIHPLTILSGLPSAGFGALLTLVIFGIELNLYSFIGIILLVGIVKKNGIMLVDFAIDKQRQDSTSIDC